MRAEVLTSWVGDGTELSPRHPSLADNYKLKSWQDVTAQPAENLTPEPNLFAIEIEADAGVIAAIESDSDYHVMWSE